MISHRIPAPVLKELDRKLEISAAFLNELNNGPAVIEALISSAEWVLGDSISEDEVNTIIHAALRANMITYDRRNGAYSLVKH